MKSQSSEFIAKEEGSERQPAELYHMWRDTTHWRYTSGDVAVVYNGETYLPASIQRGSVSYDEQLQVNKLDIQASRVTSPAMEFIGIGPADLLWVSVHKLHRDMTSEETTPVFIGQVKEVAFRGSAAQIKCVGFEHFLRQVVPRYRYGPGCQHTLYDASTCRVVKASYSHSVVVQTVSADGLTIGSGSFSSFAAGYFSYGYINYGDYSRMVTSHIGSLVTIRYPITGFVPGVTVTAVAGCDKTRDTCETKFNNLINQLGFPDIPYDNPSLWTTK